MRLGGIEYRIPVSEDRSGFNYEPSGAEGDREVVQKSELAKDDRCALMRPWFENSDEASPLNSLLRLKIRWRSRFEG